MRKLSIVVPCYNEQEIIESFYKELKNVLSELEDYKCEIIFIDDGSNDETIKILKQMKVKDKDIKIISFSRNFGKESAIFAGLQNSSGDLIVVMDSDLQHPPEKIIEMLEGIQERI